MNKRSSTQFNSTIESNVQEFIKEEQRFSSLIAVSGKTYPTGYNLKVVGSPNAIITFETDKLVISQLGISTGWHRQLKKEQLEEVPISKVSEIRIKFRRTINAFGGTYFSRIDIVTKDKTYKATVDSLKGPLALYNFYDHAGIVKVSDGLTDFLQSAKEDSIDEEIRRLKDQVPLFNED